MKKEFMDYLDDYEDEDDYDIKGFRRDVKKQKTANMKMSGKGLKDAERIIGERARGER